VSVATPKWVASLARDWPERQASGLFGLFGTEPRRPTRQTVSACVLLDCALVNLKAASEFVDGNAVGVTLDQLLHFGWFEAAADPP
jgi:hypothetical protein